MKDTLTAASRRRATASLVIAALGTAAVIGGLGYGFVGEDGRIAAGFLPVLAGGSMALFALLDVFGILRHSSSESTVLDVAQDAAPVPDAAPASNAVDIYGRTPRQRDRMLLMVIGIVLATVLLVPLLGFLLAFALMLIVIAVVVERRKVLPSVIVSAVALGVAYLIFVAFLHVPLPEGILGI